MVSDINIAHLLKDVSAQAPSGEKDLEYDPVFIELQGKAAEIDGNNLAKEDKNKQWPEIKTSAFELLTRTHDLRLAILLTRALLHTEGFDGLQKGLGLINGLVEKYWDTLYPRSEDNENPIERIIILEALSDWETIIGPLMKLPLCESKILGRFSLRDIRIATGIRTEELIISEDEKESTPDFPTIETACRECELKNLKGTYEAIHASSQGVDKLKTLLEKKINSETAPDFEKLNTILNEMTVFLNNQLLNRSTLKEPIPEENSQPKNTEIEAAAPSVLLASTQTEDGFEMIRNRQDITRILDKICKYYEQHEPGSPVPLLLKRARQLVDKNFFEIMEDLAPDSAAQIKKSISGTIDI